MNPEPSYWPMRSIPRERRGFSVGGVSDFPDREKVVDFSHPYYTLNQAILVRKGTKVDASNAKISGENGAAIAV